MIEIACADRRRPRARGLLVALAATIIAVVVPSAAAAKPAVVTVRTVEVGSPGNPAVAVVPFTDAIYQSCSDAPSGSSGCQTVGGVDYGYGIGKLEVTVKQWVAFLNKVDPSGRDPHGLYAPSEGSAVWPKYGQIDFSSAARKGRRYSVAYPEWARKPYGFASFLQAARFVNSLYNGRLRDKAASSEGGVAYVTYRVRLSRKTGRGMYDLSRQRPRSEFPPASASSSRTRQPFFGQSPTIDCTAASAAPRHPFHLRNGFSNTYMKIGCTYDFAVLYVPQEIIDRTCVCCGIGGCHDTY
jgi:hypothetical protein